MDNRRVEQLLRALEIIAGCTPPAPKLVGDVSTHHFWRMQTVATRALRAPETLEAIYALLKDEGWQLPLPYDSVKQLKDDSE